MKLIFAFFSTLLLSTFLAVSQNQPSSFQSNYAGVNAVPSQPANIADNRYKVDVNLAAFNFSFYNNYIALKGHTMGFWANSTPWQSFDGDTSKASVFQDKDFQNKYLFERINDADKSVQLSIEALLPSVLYTIDNNQAVALTWRFRSIMNVDGLGSELSRLVYHDLDVPDLWAQAVGVLDNPKIGIAQMNWVEYSAGYGRVIYDEHKHFMKVGMNLKLVQGLHAMYFQVEDFQYQVHDADTIDLFRRRVNYGRSERYDPTNDDFAKYQFDSKISPAFDIGFIYEYRPDREKYKYDMDGEYDLWMNNKNKYKWKFGLSITDIGRLKFNKAATSHDFIADTMDFDRSTLVIKDLQDFDTEFVNKFDEAPGDKRTFTMSLPTAISVQIDYHIWNNFYANLTPYWAIYDKDQPGKVHNITSYTISARYDHKWFGAILPLAYNRYGNTSLGLTVRLGPLTFGTTNFLPYFAASNIYGVDGYFALKVPIFRRGKPADRDDDKVSDKMDDCRDIPGLLVFKGCPDIDNDGIPDIYDDCPSDSGIAEYKGCPDTDGDGIIDKYDECPKLPGILAYQGCPDTDGDSIIDPRDSCPTLAGIPAFFGCPDTDGDSIIDPEDLCPEHPGPIENNGCPDTDGDGIFDYLDECPEQFGPRENNGCPWPDTDLDGILDKDDRCPNNPGPKENYGCPYTDTDGDSILDKDDECPNVPGVRENNGCPKIEEEDQEIINTAFDHLEFLSGKDVIRSESYSSLDELASLLVRKTDWRLKLSGHTDNVGSERDNLILSKRRAEAVQKYLTDKGVDKERIRVEFYGETKPMESNDTPEGRQKNRRVEMQILFE